MTYNCIVCVEFIMGLGTKFCVPELLLFIGLLFLVSVTDASLMEARCTDSERLALLKFKEGFVGPSARFSSWVPDEDCCKWSGVSCNNITGRVVSLDLHSTESSSQLLRGELRESLVQLPYLAYLDLSFNDFRQMQIPYFVGSLPNLEYLNLSHANFRGSIPDHIGNLSHLISLDLSGNGYSLKANGLTWLHGLSSLKFLDLGGVDLSSSGNWLDSVNMLPSLTELSLFACNLNRLPEYLPHVNFTSLKVVDLSLNYLNEKLPDWLFGTQRSLERLIIRRSGLYGPIPEALGSMTSLVKLDLSENYLEGPIPKSLGMIYQTDKYSSLRELDLYHNNLNGTLHEVLPNLSKLNVLDVSWNSLEGIVTDAHLSNFSSLRVLDFSGNRLALKISRSWLPPFQLESIGLHSCQLGPWFPKWLLTQNNFSSIDISDCGISDIVPDWFWDLPKGIRLLNLSSNGLRGTIPDISSKHLLSALDLNSNNFSGPIPLLPPQMSKLILANNSLSGPIINLCDFLRENNSLRYVDLSKNRLSGKVPDCWTSGKSLMILNLASNNLSGIIPESIGHLLSLNTLRFDGNALSGEIPSSIKNCTSLFVLDLGENTLSGAIPDWIGEYLSNLMILRLSSNSLEGKIPLQLCRLQSLKILDLSSNHLSGEIPRCINGFKAMAEEGSVRSYIYDPYSAYTESSTLKIKGRRFKYAQTVLVYVKLIDLSSNSLDGEIPDEITSLIGLVSLNLSRNSLTGMIPHRIGYLWRMESLDLSWNQLSCDIPTSAIELIYLASLDLSNNKLSGPIPSGKQFSTFVATSYLENKNLCGHPLPNNCSDELYEDPRCINDNSKGNSISKDREEEHEFEISSFCVSMVIGFIVGFWGIWAPLLIKTSWRHAYFQFLSHMTDQIYVLVVVFAAKIQRKFHNRCLM